MEPWLIWVLAGLLVSAAELLLPGAFLFWVGLAAVGTGFALAAFALSFGWQVAVFVGLLALGIGIGLKLRQKRAPGDVNQPHSGLAGRTGTVLAIEAGGLRVRLGDSDWPARAERGAATPDVGATVRVVSVDGTTLIVRAA
jgi:hypothetical protein